MDLFLSELPSPAAIESLYDDDHPVVVVDDWITAPEDPEVHPVVLVENDSEFAWGLAFRDVPEDVERWLLDAARSLSVAQECLTLYPGSPLEGAKPWHSIVFDGGKAYLVDDSESKLSGDGEESVKTLRPIEELDAR